MKNEKMGSKEWYRSTSKGEKEIPGCMSGMFQLFDFRHSIVFSPSSNNNTKNFNPIHSISSPQLHPHQFKGVEAPRNSLELDESAAAKVTSTACALAEEYYGVPFGIQVKKKKKDLASVVEEEKRSSSQCETPRTPSLVAKLMGLDIIPDGASTPKLEANRSQTHSPKISTVKNNNSTSSNKKPLQRRDTNVLGSRSLPETPRASSERLRDGDPRLSLQINKENVNVNSTTYLCDVQSLPPSPTYNSSSNKSRRSRDGFKSSGIISHEGNKSPRSNNGYAKEAVKQVKENICSKSRRTRVVDEKKVLVESNYSSEPSRQELSSIPYYRRGEKVEEKQVKKCKKASCEKFTERIKRQPPPSEVATLSKTLLSPIETHKTTSLCNTSSNLLVLSKNGNGASSHEKAKCITSSSRRDSSYRSPGKVKDSPVQTQDKQCIMDTIEQDPEFIYVRSVIENSCVNTKSWYSPSVPIDPLVFHHLEFNHTYIPFGSLRHKCNRKLLFDLVEEILADFLNISTDRSKRDSQKIYKEKLLELIWIKVKSFPLSDCHVIEDIEALVGRDLSEANIKHLLRHQLVVAEAEAIAFEIEDYVVESVVGEVVACAGYV